MSGAEKNEFAVDEIGQPALARTADYTCGRDAPVYRPSMSSTGAHGVHQHGDVTAHQDPAAERPAKRF